MKPRIKGLAWAGVVYFVVMFNVLQHAQGPAVNTGGGGTCGTGVANALMRWTGTTTCSTSSITDDGSSIVIKPGVDSTTAVTIKNAAGSGTIMTADSSGLSAIFGPGSSTHVAYGVNASSGVATISGNTYGFYSGASGQMSIGSNIQWDRTIAVGFTNSGGIGGTLATAFSRPVDGVMQLGTGATGSTAGWLQEACMQRNTADVTNATATLATITGLSCTVTAGRTYGFDVNVLLTSDTLDGVQLAVGGTATATAIQYNGLLFNGTTLAADTTQTSLGGVVCALTATTASRCNITGTITVNAGGTLLIQFAQNANTNANVTTATRGARLRGEDYP